MLEGYVNFDPYGAWMINGGNRIMIVFHLYCCSKRKLSMILTANAVTCSFCHVINIFIQNIIQIS